MKKLLPILLFLLSCCHVALSQDYPVQVTTIVTPPYSLYLSDYASPESNTLQVMLQLKELDRPEYRVKLRITIEGQGISLRTKATFVPRAIVLQGGVPEMLTGADLSAYLNPNNMDFLGTTQQAFMRTGMFPEGFYTFKVEVLDYVRNVVVSNAGVGNAFIILNDPPLINLPFNNDKVVATDPQNIIFSWTPRHTASPNAAFSTEYEFTLVELYPENRNPNDAIRAANSIYTTTTSSTSLNYGIMEPLLIPGRKYAFRIRAYDVSGKDLFKNNGYSEVNVFQFGDACVAPLNVQADPLDPFRVKFSWEQQDVHTGYSLEFRKEGTSTWEQQSVINDAVIVPGLQGNTTYEYRVQGQCGSIQGPFSTLATVITPASDTSAFVCGAPLPEIEINTTPLDRNLRLLDIIKTADFEVIITDLTANGDGSYKGTGRAMVPWFKLAGIRVKFSNIKVNQDLRVFSGNVTTIYSKDSRFVLSADLSRDDAEAPDTGSPTAPPAFNGMDTVLTVPITNVSIPTGNNTVIVVTTPTGQTFEIPRERNEDGTFRDTRITDANGDTWTVKSGGDIQRGPNVAPPPAYASRDSVNFRVNFGALENQYYGFDSKHFQEVAEDKININGEDYWIAWKSVETGRQDYVSATASGQTNFPAKVGFKTSNGPSLHETGSSAAFRRVSVMGLVDQQVEALTAYVRVQEGQNTEEVQVGRLNVKAYDKVQKKVIVVPVNNASVPAASAISEQLNKIYAQAVVGWEVVVEPSITVDETVIQNLDVGVSDMLSSFPENMLSFVRTFRNDVNRFVDGDAYYIFMVNNPNAGRAGFMPFNRKFGFVYTNKSTNVITTLAHELGHGAFNLRHTFSPEAMLVAEGTTDNLMDYNNGTKLKKYQWDLVRNQETINGWFEDDSESAFDPWEYLEVGRMLTKVPNVSNNQIVSFIAPTGLLYSLPGRVQDLSFKSGFLTAFTLDGERYVAFYGKSSNQFKGYHFEITVNENGVKTLSPNHPDGFKDIWSKSLPASEDIYVYFLDFSETTDCSNSKLFRNKYTGSRITADNTGYSATVKLGITVTDNTATISTKNLISYDESLSQPIQDDFNCYSSAVKFLYKYIQYKHGEQDPKEIGFLSELGSNLSKFQIVSITGFENTTNTLKTEFWNLKIDEYEDLILFKEAVKTYVSKQENSPQTTKLQITLLNPDGKETFAGKILDYLPLGETIKAVMNCIAGENANTLAVEGAYIPLCYWKDQNVETLRYYTVDDPAFTSGIIDGGIGLVSDVVNIVVTAQKLKIAYTYKNLECQPTFADFLGEYTDLINGLKDIGLNFSTVALSGAAATFNPAALFSEIAVLEYRKQNTAITDQDLIDLAKKLSFIEMFDAEAYEQRKINLQALAGSMGIVDLITINAMSCDDAQKIRDQTVQVVGFVEQLTSPANGAMRDQIISDIGTSISEYLDAVSSTGNVSRYYHGKVVFEVVAEVAGAVFTGGSANIATRMSSMTALLSKFSRIGFSKFIAKQIKAIPGLVFRKSKLKTSAGETLLSLRDDGVISIEKALPDNVPIESVTLKNSDAVFDDVPYIDANNIEQTGDLEIVMHEGREYVRVVVNGVRKTGVKAVDDFLESLPKIDIISNADLPAGYQIFTKNGSKYIRRVDINNPNTPRLMVDESGTVVPYLKPQRLANSTKLRSNLEKVIGRAPDNHQAHHIVPSNVVENSALHKEAIKRGLYDVDRASNGKFLAETDEDLLLPGASVDFPTHYGSHPNYDIEIRNQIDDVLRANKLTTSSNFSNLSDQEIINMIDDIEDLSINVLENWVSSKLN